MARERGLTYVKLDGNIGILGNGAGLVMSTLDVVAQAGGSPANFLDAGGGAKAEAITSAVEVILSNDDVKAVLFNIFGGITRCDEVANGLIEAFAQIEPDGAVRRAPRRHQRRGGPRAARRGRAAQRPRGGDDARAPPQKVVELARRDERPRRSATRGCASRASPGARARSTRSTTSATAPTSSPASRPARAARTSRASRSSTRSTTPSTETGANTAMVFVPPRVRRRLDPRGRGRRHRADRRDHRGHPRPRRAARLQPPRRAPTACAWSGRTARACSRPARPTSGSSRRRSSRRATSASSRARAR